MLSILRKRNGNVEKVKSNVDIDGLLWLLLSARATCTYIHKHLISVPTPGSLLNIITSVMEEWQVFSQSHNVLN